MNEIQLYVVPVGDDFDLGKLERRLDLLDEEELQVYRRYQVDFKKVEFAIGRILLKTQLAQRIGADPRTIHFRKNQYGKLYLPEHDADITSEQLFFNLSHTDKLIVCAMTTLSDIGVDAERSAKDHLTIMPRVFKEAEIDYVNEQQDDEEKLNAFYMVWTRKEAHMKAKGMGFSLPPLSFSVPVRPGRAAQGEWEYYTCRLLEKYTLSTALRNPTGCDIQYRTRTGLRAARVIAARLNPTAKGPTRPSERMKSDEQTRSSTGFFCIPDFPTKTRIILNISEKYPWIKNLGTCWPMENLSNL